MYRYTEILTTFSKIPDIMHFLQKKGERRRVGWTGRLYDRIMNLLKHFSKGLDSTGKLAIMVLALRNKEC